MKKSFKSNTDVSYNKMGSQGSKAQLQKTSSYSELAKIAYQMQDKAGWTTQKVFQMLS